MNARNAQSKDIDGLLKVSLAAFNKAYKKGSKEWKKERAAITNDLKQWRVMLDNEKIVAAVHVKKDWLKIGKAKILKGDVGGVCVLPEMQGKGLGTLILKDTVEWMKKQRYDISRLGGLCKYYSRFGYKRFIRRYYEFNVGTLARAGASRIVEGEILLDNDLMNKVRPFSVKDHEQSIKLSQKFDAYYSGSRILSPEEKKAPPVNKKNPLDIVFEENGKILGRMQAAESPEDISDFEAQLRIYLHGYDRRKPYVIQSMMAYMNNYAFKKGIKRITARMPFDSLIINALSELPFRFKTIETHGGISSNMLQIVNFKSLLSRLLPELEKRLTIKTDLQFVLGIGKETVALKIANGKIKLLEKASGSTVKIDEADMLKLTLGLLSFSELNIKVDAQTATFLNILFPRLPASSSNWG
jgi:predicted acetyltransferase